MAELFGLEITPEHVFENYSKYGTKISLESKAREIFIPTGYTDEEEFDLISPLIGEEIGCASYRVIKKRTFVLSVQIFILLAMSLKNHQEGFFLERVSVLQFNFTLQKTLKEISDPKRGFLTKD